MTYTQVWDAVQGQVSDQWVERDEDGARIPNDPVNSDWATFLAWLDLGNEPKTATPPLAPETGLP